MLALTRFVLGHKRLVVVFWLVVTALGVLTVAGTTKRLTNSFAMPGRSFEVNQRIVQLYGNGGSQAPYVPVLTVPAGQRVTDPAVAAKVAAVLSAARQVPGVRIVDYASTHDPAFVTADGRSTFALVFTGPEDEASQGAAGAAIGRAVTAAAPPGWQVGVTGAQLLADGSSSSKGTSLAVEAMIGSLVR
jgi:RND superfamily putative drug exporter